MDRWKEILLKEDVRPTCFIPRIQINVISPSLGLAEEASKSSYSHGCTPQTDLSQQAAAAPKASARVIVNDDPQAAARSRTEDYKVDGSASMDR